MKRPHVFNALLVASALSGVSADANAASVDAGASSISKIAVGLVDVTSGRIDHDDPRVKIVDLSGQPPEGAVWASQKNKAGYEHGDVVASAFVRTIRKFNPTVEITIYTVNPFVRYAGQANDRMNMAAVRRAAPMLKEAGVKVVMSAFGVASPEAGEKILQPFKENGLFLIAAAPNDKYDRGIFPAANKGAISVASMSAGSAFKDDPKSFQWVDFVADGRHGSGDTMEVGSSYAVPKVAAFGVVVAQKNPNLDLEGFRTAMQAISQPYVYRAYKGHLLEGRSEEVAEAGKGAMPPAAATQGAQAALASQRARASGASIG